MKKIFAIILLSCLGFTAFGQTTVEFTTAPANAYKVYVKAEWYIVHQVEYNFNTGLVSDLLNGGITVNFPGPINPNDVNDMFIYVTFFDYNGNEIITYYYKERYSSYIIGPDIGNWSIL